MQSVKNCIKFLFDGPIYKKLKGEPLTKEQKNRKITNCIPYSIELEDRLRLVYEVYENLMINNIKYEFYIIVTDIANHEWRGIPYTRQFSE